MNLITVDNIKKEWDGMEVVQEFGDVFSNNFLIPPSKETEFTIELLPGTSP